MDATLDPDRRDAFVIDAERLSAATRAALLCQFACIACVEACAIATNAAAAGVARACLACRQACVALSSAAASPSDVEAVRAALRGCMLASDRCEKLASDDASPEVARHADVFSKCRDRCSEALEPAAPLDPGAPAR